MHGIAKPGTAPKKQSRERAHSDSTNAFGGAINSAEPGSPRASRFPSVNRVRGKNGQFTVVESSRFWRIFFLKCCGTYASMPPSVGSGRLRTAGGLGAYVPQQSEKKIRQNRDDSTTVKCPFSDLTRFTEMKRNLQPAELMAPPNALVLSE